MSEINIDKSKSRAFQAFLNHPNLVESASQVFKYQVFEYLAPDVTAVILWTTFNASKDNHAMVLAYDLHSFSKLSPCESSKILQEQR